MRPCRSPPGSHADVHGLCDRRRRGCQLPASATAPRSALADAGEVRRLSRRRGRADGAFCSPTTACTSRSSSTARIRSAATDAAGVADVVLEAALTTIMDLEDSVAAVDAEDKVAAYRNWLGLMQGRLIETFRQGRQDASRAGSTRTASTPRPTAAALTLPGRSLMLVRNVGHLMTDDARARPRRRSRCPKASSMPRSPR